MRAREPVASNTTLFHTKWTAPSHPWEQNSLRVCNCMKSATKKKKESKKAETTRSITNSEKMYFSWSIIFPTCFCSSKFSPKSEWIFQVKYRTYNVGGRSTYAFLSFFECIYQWLNANLLSTSNGIFQFSFSRCKGHLPFLVFLSKNQGLLPKLRQLVFLLFFCVVWMYRVTRIHFWNLNC